MVIPAVAVQVHQIILSTVKLLQSSKDMHISAEDAHPTVCSTIPLLLDGLDELSETLSSAPPDVQSSGTVKYITDGAKRLRVWLASEVHRIVNMVGTLAQKEGEVCITTGKLPEFSTIVQTVKTKNLNQASVRQQLFAKTASEASTNFAATYGNWSAYSGALDSMKISIQDMVSAEGESVMTPELSQVFAEHEKTKGLADFVATKEILGCLLVFQALWRPLRAGESRPSLLRTCKAGVEKQFSMPDELAKKVDEDINRK